jgi:hypothetical protein
VAGKTARPALAVGAAAAGVAGVAGGLILKSRSRPKVLGVKVPRPLAKAVMPSMDVKSVAKNVGKASKKVAETSKTVSKDAERVGDQAERIGKILG